MSHNLLLNASFYELLLHVDRDLSEQARQAGCACGGVLHSARYPRKPRGFEELGPDYQKRLSFCCAKDGCRLRVTPPSVRFLGRRVYLAAVVLLVTAVMSGVTAKRVAHIRQLVGDDVSERTICRWRDWWQSSMPRTSFWSEHGARFMPPVAAERLPASLLERFGGNDERNRMVATLRFLSPLSTRSSPTTRAI